MTYSISAEGLALVQAHEGFRAEPQPLSESAWVVGYGHIRAGAPGAPVSESEASQLLSIDLAPVERMVNAHVTARLTQAQFDALVSFAVSVGPEAFAQSQVLRRVNNAEHVAAACALDAWRKVEIEGELELSEPLVRRRAAEKALYLRDLPLAPTPSAFVRAKLDYAASVLGAPAVHDVSLAAGAPAAVSAAASVSEASPALAPTPGERLTEILRSEPQTEVLLLTQVVTDEAPAEEGEIVTAHAKPAARKVGAFAPQFRMAWPKLSQPAESIGLSALLLFGLGLTLIGGSLLLEARGDWLQLGAAALFALPGLAAVLFAGFAFSRSAPLAA